MKYSSEKMKINISVVYPPLSYPFKGALWYPRRCRCRRVRAGWQLRAQDDDGCPVGAEIEREEALREETPKAAEARSP